MFDLVIAVRRKLYEQNGENRSKYGKIIMKKL